AQAEQVRPAVRIRIETVTEPTCGRADQQPSELSASRRADLLAHSLEQGRDRAFEELQADVAREPVADDDVGRLAKQIAALGVAGEVEVAGGEQRMSLERQLVPLLRFLPDREQTDFR